jgi:hypothetical protein
MSEKVKQAIQRAIDKAKKEHERHEEFERAYEEKAGKIARIVLRLLRNESIRPATAEDYAKWLRAHLENDGEITEIQDCDMPPYIFYVAQESLDLPAGPEECWSGYYQNDLLLIVRAELEIKCERGYCHTYRMGQDQRYVPLFRDVQRILLYE